MEELKALYESYIAQGLLSSETTFEQFLNANDSIKESLYKQGVDSKVISNQTDLETFKSAWGDVKKKDSDLPAPEEVTESITETQKTPTSSESSERVIEVELEDPKKSFDSEVFREMTPEEKTTARIPEETQEKPTLSTLGVSYFEKKFGRSPLTNLIGDIVRAWDQGQAQPVEESVDLYLSGKNVSSEEIQDYINQVKESQTITESDEMRDFYKTYEEEGSGVYGFLKGLYNNPTIVPEILVSSTASMVTKPTVLAAGAGGAAAGSVIPFIGTGVGAIGAATATLETALTFNELLQQELGDKDFTEENIRQILNDSEKLNKIRTRAAGRGATIGVIDAITGKVAGKVAGKVIEKTGKKLLGTGAGLGIEFSGGVTGETAGVAVAGQEQDVAQSLLEGIGGTATAPISLGKALLVDKSKINLPQNLLQQEGTYTINGEEFTKEAMVDIINNMTEEDIGKSNAKILIKNDPETNKLLQTKLNNYAIQEQKTGDILDAEPAESVQEVEEEVREPSIETEEEAVIKDSQIPTSKEIYTIETEEGEGVRTVEITINKDGSRSVVQKVDGDVASSDNIPAANTLNNNEYVEGSFGSIVGEPQILAMEEVMNPKMKDKLTNKQKQELGIEEGVDETPVVEAVEEKTTKQTSKAEALKNRINKASKSPGVEGTVAQSVKQFLRINPRTVSDIDAYISQAESIVEGLKKSKTFKGDVKIAESVNIKKLDDYSSKELKAQEQTLGNQEAKAFEELTGLSSEELSLGEMREILYSLNEESVKTPEEIKLKAEKKADIIAKGIQKAFSSYSSIIKQQIKTGVDPFTGEKIKISANNKKIIEDYLKIDLNNLNSVEQLKALDALVNFATNQSTGGMKATIAQNKGVKEANGLDIIAKSLEFFKSKGVSQAWIKYISSIPLAFEFMFKGQSKGLRFEQASGFSDIKNGAAKAEAENNKVFDEYVKKYKKTKPNGEAFNTVDNDVERGMFAFMRRTVDGTLEEQQQEFKRRKGLVEKSIDKLKQTGETNDQTKAEVYEKIYNKILKDATTIDEVDAKVDAINKEAVEWITNEWASRRDDLADISLNVYNRILGKDINYTPDSFTLVEEPSSTADIGEPIFEGTREVIYDKETGVLKPKNPSFVLPEGRIVNLGFDSQNSRSLNAALTDIYTAEGIQQLKGFVNSDAYSKIIPNKSDRDLITERLRRYVDAKRGVSFIKPSNKAFIKGLNKFSSLGVGRALGGPTQFIKQLTPIVNTMANAGPVSTIKGLTLLTNPAVNKFLNNSGYGIANRGIQALSVLESSNSKIENAAKSNLGKAVDQLNKINQAYLQFFVANPDKFAARASWLSYYTNSLKKQGINPNGIDWNTHKINKEAADFAEQQVTRQQNVSDIDLQGEIFNSKNPFVQMGRKIFLPFANFLLNQKTRMYSDISTLANTTSTSQDKTTAAKSLGGLAAETIAFNAIGLILLQGLDLATIEEDDEERKQKMLENRVKGRLGNIIKDIISPLPVTDVAIIAFANYLLKQFFEEEPEEVVQLSTSRKTAQPKKKEPFQLFSEDRKSFVDNMGVLGINVKNADYLFTLSDMAFKGEYQKEYMGKKGKVKKLDPKYNDVAKMNFAAYFLYSIGLLPSETATIVRGNVKDMQKQKKEIKLSTSR